MMTLSRSKLAGIFAFFFLGLAARGADAPPIQPGQFHGFTPLQWSSRMANSEITRRGDSLFWKEGGAAKWDYTTGLFALALLRLEQRVPDFRFGQFAEDAIGSFIDPDGHIYGYRMEDYSLDNINSGKAALTLYGLTRQPRYEKAVGFLRQQLDSQPRTSDGGFWHKEKYTNQMWLDGIYMAAPFLAQCGRQLKQPADFDEATKQILLIGSHTYDPHTGLFYHGWDAAREQSWANRDTGTSPNFWGRAMGWYGMAMVDTLDFLPPSHPDREAVVTMLRKLADGVVKYQDPASGLWWQVMDQPNHGNNYLEATASSMFVYTLAKGVNHGYLPREYGAAALKGYEGITGKLIETDASGSVNLIHCCSVAGLGFGRDGSFAYYVSEPVVTNDLKGVGPFILAGLEIHDLQNMPAPAPGHVDAIPPVAPMTPAAATGGASDSGWAMEKTILARIHEPVFADRNFPITTYGAIVGGEDDCTAAIRQAIAACNQAGGGHVIVPAGEFLTGPILLKSGVDLHLEEGATLKFSTNPLAYLPAVFTRHEGIECFNYSPFIYAFHQENIAVTGSGTLDGQAGQDNWWQWKGRPPGTPAGSGQESARARLGKLCDGDASVFDRMFGDGDFLRPNFIQPNHCRNVLIEGVHIRRSPMWEIHPVVSTNVIVRGVDIMSHGPNNDGCDPECCLDVLIEHCVFDTGDDCIAIKSGRNDDGRRVGLPSANLIIRDCTMKDGHGGVAIGSEISGGCSNVFVENCVMDSPHLERALRLKSNAMRGGVLENIFMRNVKVGQVADAVLQIDFMYEEGPRGPYQPVARNVVIENVTVDHTPRVFNITGFPAAEISGVRVLHSTFHKVQRDDVIHDAADVKIEDCVVERGHTPR